MLGETVCKHNQSGFCKFKNTCRNKHENTLCPKDDHCTSKECLFRHPKSCKNYKREGTCRFKEFCAYKHDKDKDHHINVKELITNHEQEMSAIKHEMNQLKLIISQMGNQIMILNQELQNTIQINVQEIVKIVVETLDKSKDPVQPSEAEQESPFSVHCDHCEFNCKNEKLMSAHMSKKHGKGYSCEFCGRYFGTKKFLEDHNKTIHNGNHNLTESECEDTLQEKSNEVEQNHKEKKQKKKKANK